MTPEELAALKADHDAVMISIQEHKDGADESVTTAEYLGWTEDEYRDYVAGRRLPPRLYS